MTKNYPVLRGWIRPVVIDERVKDKDGYWILKVRDHYLVGSCRISEHRLVMIEKLGRRLRREEHVHHDKIRRKTHNHPDNLVLMSPSNHAALHNSERVVSMKTRAKMSRRMTGNKNLLGYRHSDETRERIRRSHVGVPKGPPSLETRIKLAIASGERRHSKETKEKIRLSLLAHHRGN